MSLFDSPDFDNHESVTFFSDEASGLRAIIAVHSTVRGPASGGARLWSYDSDQDALRDVLRLSRGMSLKCAMADLPLGGGKAVIMKPDGAFDRTAMFTAYGACVERLGGQYITAEDVGVTPNDMRAVRTQTRFVGGLPEGEAASGDPSPITARGVFMGIKACVERAFGRDDLRDMRIAVQGLGHVGSYLCGLLHEAGARLIVTDVDLDAMRDAEARFGATTVEPDAIYDQDVEVFSPCALGAIVNAETLPRLKCKVIAGGANNQLSTPAFGEQVLDAGILYAPDYVINGGGIINVAAEISGKYDPEWVDQKLDRLIDTLGEVLDAARAEGRPTNFVAEDIARSRIVRPEPAPAPAE